MGFYLRKAFKTGPVRLNLSKGGLGLSAGVTGARVGINSRGTYVHGGRHGLYYRKYQNSSKSRKKQTRQSRPVDIGDEAVKNRRESGPVDLFRNTGVTFSSRSAELREPLQQMPEFPVIRLFPPAVTVILISALLLLLIALTVNLVWLSALAILAGLGSAGWVLWNYYWKRKSEKKLSRITSFVENGGELTASIIGTENKIPVQCRKWLDFYLYAVVGELAMRREELDTIATFRILDDQTVVEKKIKEQIRASILADLLDEMLEDHRLSEEEESEIRNLIKKLDLPEELAAREIERLDHYSSIRREIDRPLQEIDPGIPLVRGEGAFEHIEEARLLNERVMDRFQHKNVRYRELGYEIDLEGELILTDRRFILVGRGTREYRINRIFDITADPEAGLVELVLSDRKSPLLITVKEPMVLAARLEKLLEENRG